MNSRYVWMAFIVGVLFSAAAVGTAMAADPEYVYTSGTMKFQSEPKGLPDVFRDRDVEGGLAAVAAGLGVDPGYVSAVFEVGRELTHTQNTEDFHYSLWNDPSGRYQYCGVRLRVTSAAPEGGDRQPHLDLKTYSNNVGGYVWAGRENFGGSPNWLSFDYTVLAVRADLAESRYRSGKCVRPHEGELAKCRGRAGGEFGGQRVYPCSVMAEGPVFDPK